MTSNVDFTPANRLDGQPSSPSPQGQTLPLREAVELNQDVKLKVEEVVVLLGETNDQVRSQISAGADFLAADKALAENERVESTVKEVPLRLRETIRVWRCGCDGAAPDAGSADGQAPRAELGTPGRSTLLCRGARRSRFPNVCPRLIPTRGASLQTPGLSALRGEGYRQRNQAALSHDRNLSCVAHSWMFRVNRIIGRPRTARESGTELR